MKKRLLSALLALALVFVLLPTTALAETPAIKIAGTVIEDGKYYYTNGGIGELKTEAQQKTWNVRRDGNTLYLKNAKINTTDTQSIQVWMMSVTINLEGDSTITTKGEGSIVSQFAGSLTIKGNGKLTIESNTAGSSIVWNSGDVTITGDAVVNITNKNSGQLSEAIGLTNSYELTVSGNAKLKAVSNGSKAATVNSKKLTIADNAEFNVINQNSSGKAVSFKSIEVAAGYDCNGINGNGITDWTKTTAEELNTFQKVWVKPTPTPTLEKSNVYVAGTNLYKNTAYTIQNGKPVMGGTYPGNYNIYFDATDYVLHVKDAVIDATGTTGIYGTSNIVFEGDNSITASSYGIYSYFKSSDLKISGSGSLMIKTIAACPAIATDYNTSRSIIISGNNFTVTADTSGTTSYAIKSDKDLTITDGAAVTAKSNATRAIDIKGDLTVTNGSLTATSTSDSVPTVQVGGNASFTGSTVTITNNSTTQGKSGKNSYEVSTGLYVGGTLDIKNAAKVTSTVIGGNAIYAKGDITISGDSTEVKATNDAYKFSAISTNGTVNISDNSTVKAENLKKHQGDPTGETDPSTGKTYNACPAITGKIANKNTQNKLHIAGFTTSNPGTSNPTDGVVLNLDINPSSAVSYILHYDVTITRGDKVVRTPSPVDIDGHTLLNDTYYTITNDSTVVANGSESNYNAFYSSTTKTLKLNNAQISTTTNNAAIKISEDLTITVTGTNELNGNYNHCIESDNNFKINGTGRLVMTNGSNTAASVIYCGPYKNLTIAAEVIIKNEAQPGYLIHTGKKDANSFAEGYNVYASTNVSGSPLEVYNPENYGTYKYLRVTKENLAPTTPTTYTVTITAGDNMKRESGALTQEVTKGAAITEVKFMAASGHYFPADYVSKMNLPAGLTAEIRENSWYLIISGTPTSDVTINLPAASVRPTITVSMPTPVAGNTPATANDITLTYSDINKSVSKKLSISNVVWWSYVSNGDGSITPGNTLSSGDKFEAGTEYYVTIDFEGVSENYAIVPAADTTAWRNAEWGSRTMTLYFNVTGAPCNHEYTNDWLANGNTHWHECKLCRAHAGEVAHTFGDWITDTPATDTTDGSKHRTCSVCQYQENATIPKTGTGEIVPPTPDNPGTIVIIRPAEEEKPAQQPNPSTGANDLVGLAVAAAVAAALGSAALLRKHD